MAFTKELRTELVSLLGEDWVKDDPVTLYTYRCDGLTLYTAPPMGVVFPGNRNELVEVVKKTSLAENPLRPQGRRNRTFRRCRSAGTKRDHRNGQVQGDP